MFHILYSLDLLSTIVFAMSGALLAIECHQKRRLFLSWSLLRVLLYAGLTALGGGTLRDLLLARSIFWVRSPTYLFVTLSIGLLTFILATHLLIAPKHLQSHLWFPEALSLATFTVVGTQVAVQQLSIASHAAFCNVWMPLLWLLPPCMGVLTGVGGGILRDLLSCRRPYAIQHPHYPLTALLGGSLYQLISRLQLPDAIAIGSAIAIIIIILRLFILSDR